MLSKRGQITTFLVIGIIILFVTGAVLYARSVLVKEQITPTPAGTIETAQLKSYVEACLASVGEEAVIEIGKTGGFIYPVPLPSMTYNDSDIYYWYYINTTISPSKEVIENEISNYLRLYLGDCLADFTNFRAQGYNITTGSISPNITIASDKVLMKVNYPVTMKRGAATAVVPDYEASVNVRLGKIIGIVEQLIVEQEKKPDMLCMSCLTLQAVTNNIRFENKYYDDMEYIRLIDDTVKVRNIPYEFSYAVKLAPLVPT
jgi:hypothetical protein